MGAQGVWFILETEPGHLYHYFSNSIESGLAVGVLRREADGEARFYELAGRRVAGTATIRSETTRDVATLQVMESQ